MDIEKAWLDAGFTPSEIDEWSTISPSRVHLISAPYVRDQFDTDTYTNAFTTQTLPLNVNPEWARTWMTVGKDLETALKWSFASDDDIDTCRTLKGLGFRSPMKARSFFVTMIRNDLWDLFPDRAIRLPGSILQEIPQSPDSFDMSTSLNVIYAIKCVKEILRITDLSDGQIYAVLETLRVTALKGMLTQVGKMIAMIRHLGDKGLDIPDGDGVFTEMCTSLLGLISRYYSSTGIAHLIDNVDNQNELISSMKIYSDAIELIRSEGRIGSEWNRIKTWGLQYGEGFIMMVKSMISAKTGIPFDWIDDDIVQAALDLNDTSTVNLGRNVGLKEHYDPVVYNIEQWGL